MNILYAHRTRGRDVEGVHIRGIVDALRYLGHNVRILSVPGADPYANASAKPHNKNVNFWTRISNLIPQLFFEILELSYNLIAYFQCAILAQQHPIDIIYERYALNNFATTLFARLHRIPIIHEVNDATGIVRQRNHKFNSISKAIEKWVFSNSSHIITISSYFQKLLLKRNIPESKCSYLPNAIDDTKFDPNLCTGEIKQNLMLNGKLIIGFAGGFATWHGIDLLTKIIPKVLTVVKNAHFLLVGDGKAVPCLREWIAENHLQDSVTLTGAVPFQCIPEYIYAFDIGMIPDSNLYGSPMKLFEYMAMAKAVVAPDLPPIRDVAFNGRTIALFRKGDSLELANILIHLCNNETARTCLGLAARVSVINNHTWKANAIAIERILYNFIK